MINWTFNQAFKTLLDNLWFPNNKQLVVQSTIRPSCQNQRHFYKIYTYHTRFKKQRKRHGIDRTSRPRDIRRQVSRERKSGIKR
jgi:hypothetical protein